MDYRIFANLPWFMFDLASKQLITSVTIPDGDIGDKKDVIITETPIPGRNFQPISQGGNGNRKISFSIPIVSRLIADGNVGILKQFDALRNQSRGIYGLRAGGQFRPNPKVLYMWGVGSVPLPYYVTSCSFTHRADMVNAFGNPTYTKVDMELTLDETDPLYKAEEIFRSVAAALGQLQGAAQALSRGRLI